jgi:hypothetical protein
VQLQLLQAPAGYDMFLQHRLPQQPPMSVDDCVPGVLLQALLPRAGVAVHPGSFAVAGVEDQESDGEEGEGSDSSEGDLEALLLGGTIGSSAAAAELGSGEAADGVLRAGGPSAAGATSVPGAGAGASGAQQQQQPQQLLLVGTKVTGDRNVPAGQVTFAVDLASRSTEGAGQPLQLPPGVHSAVDLGAAGTQPLIVKVGVCDWAMCLSITSPVSFSSVSLAVLQFSSVSLALQLFSLSENVLCRSGLSLQLTQHVGRSWPQLPLCL